MDNNWYEIRCPYEKLSRSNGQLYKCNSLCVKVSTGSSGEARCRKCYANFVFTVVDGKVQTQTVQQVVSAGHTAQQ